MEPFQSWVPEKVPVSKILPNQNNPRTIAKVKLEKLQQNMKDLGLFKPLICRYDYSLLGGTQRTRIILSELPASFELWITRPPHDLTEEEYQKVLLLDNSHYGEWDIEILANNFEVSIIKQLDINIAIPDVLSSPEDLNDDSQNTEQLLRERKYILEVQLHNELDLRDLYDDLTSKGYSVKEKSMKK